MRNLVILFTAVGLFGQTTGQNAWQMLDRRAHDTNPVKRRQAILAMGILRPLPPALGVMEAALDDKDIGVREAGCITLGEANAKTSIPKLQMALADASPEVIFAAAKALYALGDPAGRQVLGAILLGDQKDASSFMSSSMRDARSKLHDPRQLLIIGLRDGSGFAGPAGIGVPFAMDLMKDSQASGKTEAALLLATDRSPDTLKVLKDALADKNWTVRAAAARAIALRDAPDLYDDVAKLLADKREEVQLGAAAALVRLKQQPETPGAKR